MNIMLNDEVFEQWCRDLGLSEQTKELIAHKQRLMFQRPGEGAAR